MIDYGFSIQDFVQGYPLQSWLSVMLRALGYEEVPEFSPMNCCEDKALTVCLLRKSYYMQQQTPDFFPPSISSSAS